MKIERLTIVWNNYDFENDGVPAKSYGAKVDLVGPAGRLITPLYADTTDKILQMVSPEVVAYVESIQRSVKAHSLINNANLLEHDGGVL